MAPPLKRRKLSSSAAQDIAHLDYSTAPSNVLPHHSFSTESLHPSPASDPARIETEDEEQRPKYARIGQIQPFKVLVPRQVGVSATLPSIPSPTLPAFTSPTLTSVPITSASIPAATIPAGVTPTESSSSSSSTSSSSSSSSTTSTRPSHTSNSTSLTTSLASSTSSNSTVTDPHTSSHSNSTTTAKLKDTVVATLSDGDTVTITEQNFAFTTTLVDGELFTVPGLLKTPSSARTSSSSIDSVTSASISADGGQSQITLSSSAPATTTTTAAAEVNHSSNDNTAPAGVIAGGVVGGAAGLAVVLFIAMVFIRWYRGKSNGQHRALPPGSADLPDHDASSGPSGPGMAERAGLMPLMSAVPGLLRHQNRSVTASPEPSERGFTRVSGRKLPSAWSEGMSSEDVTRLQQQSTTPLVVAGASLDRNLSQNSSSCPDRDSYGYPGTASPTSTTSPTSPISRSSTVPITNSVHEMMTVSAGPQRQPQVHRGGPYTASPSPNAIAGFSPASATAFARGDTRSSLRNSRFTEDM